MKIHLYSIAWNEEKIMPYFMKYYSSFCEKIVIYDNESTDKTPDIVKSYNGEVRSWGSNNQVNDLMYLDIKNNAYKESRDIADWVIVCDTDEFLYHPNLLNKLEQYKNKGITFPKIKGFEMIPNCELKEEDNLPLTYQKGARFINLDKRAIFNPKLDIQYGVGCHTSNLPIGAVESPMQDIRLMHYKMLNVNYFIERHQLLGSRLSDLNKKNQWGGHYTWTNERMTQEYNKFLSQVEQVI
jgi:glycosyltransferase involved in cell wall biosynthesis